MPGQACATGRISPGTATRAPPGATTEPGKVTTMIDAPDFGATVRQEPIQRNLVGISRPNQT
jgi:hypothetical protein